MQANDYSFDIIPGLRIIFECEKYHIRPKFVSGFVALEDGGRHHFTLINRLCTIEDMGLFDPHAVAKAVQAGYEAREVSKGRKGLVNFYPHRTGIRQ